MRQIESEMCQRQDIHEEMVRKRNSEDAVQVLSKQVLQGKSQEEAMTCLLSEYRYACQMSPVTPAKEPYEACKSPVNPAKEYEASKSLADLGIPLSPIRDKFVANVQRVREMLHTLKQGNADFVAGAKQDAEMQRREGVLKRVSQVTSSVKLMT